MPAIPRPQLGDSNPLSLVERAAQSFLLRKRSSIPALHAPNPITTLLKRHPITSAVLNTRQSSALIPANYTNLNSGPAPGTVVGIVLGSVAGFLLILWLLYTCFGGGSISFNTAESSVGSVVVRERKRSHHRSRASETVRSVPMRPPPAERIVVTEERRERRREVSRSPIRSEGEDEVVVIEEHSPPRRSKSKRESRESGYRTVDPLAYGGGDRPMRKVSGRR